jgi:ATP-dependent exoDNAse (exonuclease V) alpha subunit
MANIKQKFKSKGKQIKLTEGQAIALDSVLKFLANRSDRTYALFGYAGVGKTFLTKLIIEHCHKKDLKVVLAAPTNKAAKVLSQTTGEEAITIAKMLGLRPKIDQTTGKEIYTRDPDAKTINLENYDLVILDETSMIGSELMTLLSEQLTLFSAKFLFLGDPAQLPPVGEEKSPVFAQIFLQLHRH